MTLLAGTGSLVTAALMIGSSMLGSNAAGPGHDPGGAMRNPDDHTAYRWVDTTTSSDARLRGLSADGVDQVDLSDAVAVPSALGKLPPRPLPPKRPAEAQAPGEAPRPADGAPKGRRQEPSATDTPASRRARTQPSNAAARADAGTDAVEHEKPRLQAVRTTPRPVAPSLLEKAQAALAEAEEAAADAADEAARRAQAQEEAAADFVRLTAEVNDARQRLRALELSLDAARKERETAAAESKQYARAAEKSERSAVLAKERVLRLRNTPD